MVDDYLLYIACKYFQGQLERIITELKGAVIAENIESIHQSRVAARRLRAGLSFFDPVLTDKQRENWLSHTRKITSKLGLARDRDVQIEFVSNYLKDITEKKYKPGIERLLLRLNQSRKKAQPKVIKSINKFASSSNLDDFLNFTVKALAKYNGNEIPSDKTFFYQHSKNSIESRIDDLMAFKDSLKDSQDISNHHRMRIAAKKLRYTLEICNPGYDGELAGSIKTVKKIQTYLGDIHDMDVWQEYIKDFISKEKRKTTDYYGDPARFKQLRKGLDHMHEYCGQRRIELFDGFVAFWNKTGQNKVQKKLRDVLEEKSGSL